MSGRDDALVGFTGLVGSNLSANRPFGTLVNSRNPGELQGRRFGQVVFSAARAEKWRANADPAADARHIDGLIDLLGSFSTDRLTVISTVDVFASPIGVDETSPPASAAQHAYGAGRHRLELAARALHDDVLVVRLPALFGRGLKKNVIFDLLHDNGVEKIQPESEFQYYDLSRLSADLDLANGAGHDLVHLVTEPVKTADVLDRAFRAEPLPPREDLPVVRYDVRSRHASTFGGDSGYIEAAEAVLGRLGRYVAAVRAP